MHASTASSFNEREPAGGWATCHDDGVCVWWEACDASSFNDRGAVGGRGPDVTDQQSGWPWGVGLLRQHAHVHRPLRSSRCRSHTPSLPPSIPPSLPAGSYCLTLSNAAHHQVARDLLRLAQEHGPGCCAEVTLDGRPFKVGVVWGRRGASLWGSGGESPRAGPGMRLKGTLVMRGWGIRVEAALD